VPNLVADGAVLVNIGNVYSGGGYGSTSKIARGRRGWKDTTRDAGRRGAPFAYSEGNLVLIGPLLVQAIQRRCSLYFRAEVVWHKPTAGEPATIVGRPPGMHEFVYMLSRAKQSRLHDPGEAWWRSDVWTIAPGGDQGPSTAAMPLELARRLVLVSTVAGETVLDPFAGGATTLLAADRLGSSNRFK
jgi:DNA modification methylase